MVGCIEWRFVRFPEQGGGVPSDCEILWCLAHYKTHKSAALVFIRGDAHWHKRSMQQSLGK